LRRIWRSFTTGDGVKLATERTIWGAPSAPVVLGSHATGFCKEVFRPVIDGIMGEADAGDILTFDHRAHGDSTVPDPPYDWWDLGHDVLTVLDGANGVIGVGHSAGAASLLLAELLAPGTFSSMVLVEPIVFPGPYGRAEHALVEAALKRKANFASPAAAFENFVDKPAFSGWDNAALTAYVEGGLRPDRDHWTLKCPPEAEAEFYRGSTAHAAWERLGEVASHITLIAGEHSDTHPGEFLERTAEQLGGGHVEVVPETSHFVLMEQPWLVASHVLSRIAAESGQITTGR
jgi:pimeloyl-ACP methyl ester carboxylesterase